MIRRLLIMLVAVTLASTVACSREPANSMKEIERAKAADLDVVLMGPSDALTQGKGFAILEFRDATGSLVDVGSVKVNATMPMAGMAPMIGGSEVKATPAPGRYEIATDFSMAGTWQLAVEWDGPRGRGATRFPGRVR